MDEGEDGSCVRELSALHALLEYAAERACEIGSRDLMRAIEDAKNVAKTEMHCREMKQAPMDERTVH